MNILGQIILLAGVYLFFGAGFSLIMGIIPRDPSVIVPSAAMALIFTGVGAGLTKKHRKQDY